jgi:hypothetical protein
MTVVNSQPAVQTSPKLGLVNNGLTPDGRYSYTINNPMGNESVSFSVKPEDSDSFEKSVATMNEFGAKANDPKEIKKNKIKSLAAFIGLLGAGIAAPAILTRNSKTWVKILSTVGGGVAGFAAGVLGFVKCAMPKGMKEAQKAQEVLATLDIRPENIPMQ